MTNLEILKIAIEYDGYYFHKNNQEMDLEKNTFLSEQKIKLIRIRENVVFAITLL